MMKNDNDKIMSEDLTIFLRKLLKNFFVRIAKTIGIKARPNVVIKI